MRTRKLGKNGFRIGEVGLGCWQFGGDFGEMSEETAFAILEESVRRGVTFYDTADVYGAGRSENLIGRFLRESGNSLVVATKFGRGGGVFPDNYSEANMRRCVNSSLKRLGVDTLDLLQLHCVPTEVLRQGEIFKWLRSLQRDGLIKHFGASVETVEQGNICLEQDGLLSLQVIFNIFRQKLVKELLPDAQAKGVGIIVRLPLASGLLAGKYTEETTFSESDHRTYNRDGEFFSVGETFAGLPFKKGVQLAEHLKQFLPGGMSLAQFSLRWILDHDAVSVIIPGASSVSQAESNATISDLPPLSADLHDELNKFYWEEVHDHIRGVY